MEGAVGGEWTSQVREFFENGAGGELLGVGVDGRNFCEEFGEQGRGGEELKHYCHQCLFRVRVSEGPQG